MVLKQLKAITAIGSRSWAADSHPGSGTPETSSRNPDRNPGAYRLYLALEQHHPMKPEINAP
jgi:hypothetical protein